MASVLRTLGIVASMAYAAAVPAATFDAPVVPATGATGTAVTTSVGPADRPATPRTIPTMGVGAAVVTGAILIGIGAALVGGTGNEPAPIPSGTGTTGTL